METSFLSNKNSQLDCTTSLAVFRVFAQVLPVELGLLLYKDNRLLCAGLKNIQFFASVLGSRPTLGATRNVDS